MTQVSDMLKKQVKKEMMSAGAQNYSVHGDIDSMGEFLSTTNELTKDIAETDDIEKNDDAVLDLINRIVNDMEEEEMSKEETKEATGASSAGGYSMPLFGKPQKRKIKEREEKIKGGLADGMSLEDLAKHHNTDVQTIIEKMEKGVNVEMEHTSEMIVAFEIAMDHIYEDLEYYDKLEKIEGDTHKEESKEATTSSSVGVYDAPIGGGRKNPLEIDTPKSVYSKLRSVQDKNFPKYGGKDGKYVKIKDKCKKFPYCNQGDINALEFFENNLVKEAIKRVTNKYNVDETYVKSVILERLKK